MSKIQVLKFAGYKKIGDVQNNPYIYEEDYVLKTPLIRFGESINDVYFEFNDDNFNSYCYKLFNKTSLPFKIKLNNYVHIVIVISDNNDKKKKRNGVKITTYLDGKMYTQQIQDIHINFNYGNLYIFPE